MPRTRLLLTWPLLLALTLALGVAHADSIDPTHPAAPLPDEAWDLEKAAHLFRRAGFGGTANQVRTLAARGRAGAVDHLVDFHREHAEPALQLRPSGIEDPAIDALVRERIKALTPRVTAQVRQRLAAAPEATRGRSQEQIEAYIRIQVENRALQEAGRQLNDQMLFQLRSWWLARMVTGKRPLEEKLILFWTNHFPSHYETVNRQATLLVQQHALFREHAAGSFADLLHGIVRDPAMLQYLDNTRNTKASPNENLARELFELFALGVGHYTERDIKEAARALTGYTALGRRFVYDRRQHDYGDKTIFGQTGPWIGKDVVRLTLARRQTARHVSAKLATYFLGRPPSKPLADALADTFYEHGYQLRPVLRQLFSSREFYSDAVVGSRIKSPVELLVGAVRQLDLPLEGVAIGGQLLQKMGQRLFHPPNVKGWDGGRAWINSATLLSRHNLIADLVKGAQDLENRQDGAKLKRLYLPNNLHTDGKQWTADKLLNLPLHRQITAHGDPDRALREIVARMELASPLPAAKLAELRETLMEAGWGDNQRTRLQIIRVALLVSGTPQYQLN